MTHVKQCFTGQSIEKIAHGKEYVRCACCQSDDLISLQAGGWFDRFKVNTDTGSGQYVHYSCLSQERKKELALPNPG